MQLVPPRFPDRERTSELEEGIGGGGGGRAGGGGGEGGRGSYVMSSQRRLSCVCAAGQERVAAFSCQGASTSKRPFPTRGL